MDADNSDIIIGVIGMTGAGKTTFISKASGRNDLEIGHSLDSCTQSVLAVRFRHQGKNVTLIDTPGFDDSFTSDADILKVIAEYMGEIYSQGQLLNGLIFLQPINGNKAGGNERKRTRLFKKVLGENAYCRVIIGTTMWGNLLNDAKGVQQQEDRIKNMAIWGDMVKHGACVVRHEDTVESAMNIVEMVMDFPPVALQLQQELEKSGGNLAATSAGRQLDEDLGEVVQKLSAELEALRKDRDASREEREQLQSQLIQLREQRYSVRHAVLDHWRRYVKKPLRDTVEELLDFLED